MEKRYQAINMRFSPEQAKKIREIAAKNGISVKTLVLIKCGVLK